MTAPPLDLWRGSAAFSSAFAAGAVNSVAGGGTLLSFPTLIWLGLDSVIANATSTVGIWPGQLGGVVGYREELRRTERRFRVLIAPSLIGGLIGALLLRWTPSKTFSMRLRSSIAATTWTWSPSWNTVSAVGIWPSPRRVMNAIRDP